MKNPDDTDGKAKKKQKQPTGELDELRARVRELEEKRRFFSSLANNLPGVVYRCKNDPDWTMTFISEGCRALTGYDVSEIEWNRKVSYAQIIHPEDRQTVWDGVQEALRENRSFRFVYRIATADGLEKWVWEQGHGVFSDEGEMSALEGVIIDITEQKQAEKELREKEKLYHLITDNMTDTVWLMDMDLRTVFISPSVARTRGYTLEELRDMPLNEHLTPASLEVTLGAISEEMTSEKLAQKDAKISRTLELEFYRKDGSTFWNEVKITLIRDDEGHPTGFLGVGRDITERRRAEEELHRLNRELRLLHLAGQTFNSTLAVDEVLNFVLEEVRRLLDATACSVWLVEQETGELVCRHSTGPKSEMVKGWRLSPGEGIVGWVAHHGEKLVVSDVREDSRHFADVDRQTGLELRSIIGLPLASRGASIGVLLVMDEKVDRFGSRELVLLELLAASAAIAIENARLYEQARQEIEERRRAEESFRRSEERYRLLTDTAMDIIIAHDVEGQIFYVNRAWQHISGYDEAEALRMSIADILPPDTPYFEEMKERARKRKEEGDRGVNLYEVEFVVKSGRRVPVEFSSAPIVQGDEPAAILIVARDITRRKLAEQEVYRRNRELMLLNQVIAASAASLEPEVILETACRELALAFGLPNTTASLINDERTEAVVVAEYREGDRPSMMGQTFRVKDNLALQHLLVNKTPLVSNDARNDPRLTQTRDLIRRRGAFAMLLLPLIVEEEVIGTLALDSAESRRFQAEEVSLAWSVADQLSLAIRQARLHEQVQRHAAELEQKVAERTAELRESEHRFRTIADFTYEWEYWMGADGQFVYVSPACLRVTGYSADEFMKDPSLLERIIHPDDLETADFSRYKSEKRRVHIVDFRIVTREGEERWISHSCQPVYGADGKWLGRRASNRDVTKRKRMEEELRQYRDHLEELVQRRTSALVQANEKLLAEIVERERAEAALEEERALLARRVEERTLELSQANAELARAARLKDEFLASMSHELRTPLSAILGMSEVLTGEVYGPLNEKQHHSVRTVEESGRHLLNLINDILDVSKIEAGEMKLDIAPLSVEGVCMASLQLVKQQAHKKRISVHSGFDPAVTIMEADERRVKQVLVNLLSNAVKFTPEGGEVGLEVTGDAEEGVVRFTVWDTGIGIAEEDMGRLFRPFVQLDSSLSRQYTGTGLGLSLVYRLVEIHGGGISVESVVGEGSRFTASLPWKPVGEEPGDEDDSAPDDGRAFTGTRESPALVLLAEDNRANVDTLSAYLTAGNYRLVVAGNGFEVLEKAKEERPDVILMDIQMPGMDGLEATRRIRADEELSGIPVIALTALAMPGDRERCIEAGADEYLSKPVGMKELLRAIETLLNRMN